MSDKLELILKLDKMAKDITCLYEIARDDRYNRLMLETYILEITPKIMQEINNMHDLIAKMSDYSPLSPATNLNDMKLEQMYEYLSGTDKNFRTFTGQK